LVVSDTKGKFVKTLTFIFLLSLPLFSQTFARAPQVTTCNVIGDKIADDTAAIQACINATPDDSELIFPAFATMKITATVTANGRYGIKFKGLAERFGGPSATTPMPGFYWFGPDGGTMVDFNRCDNCGSEGLLYFNAPGYIGGTGGANIALNVDQTVPPPGTSTADLFERNSFVSGTQNPNFVGIMFAAYSTVNVEAMTVRGNFFSCSYGAQHLGNGIAIGNGGFYNAKKHLYQDNTFTNCAVDISLTGGSADILNNKFNESTINIIAQPVDPIKIDGNDSENATQFIVGNLGSPITVSDNRIAAVNPPAGQGAIWITRGPNTLTMIGNAFDCCASYMPVAFANHVGGSLHSQGNAYPVGTATFAGFYTVTGGFTSQHDTGLTTPMLGWTGLYSGGGYYGNFGGLVYDDSSLRWKLSNNLKDPSASQSHILVSEPATGFTLAGNKLGTCFGGNDLATVGGGFRQFTSSFSSFDTNGYIHVNAGGSWSSGDYFISGVSSSTVVSVADPPTGGLTNGSFTVNRGRQVFVPGLAGVADTMWVCAQTATGMAWKQIF
jgi:hypothetical protein